MDTDYHPQCNCWNCGTLWDHDEMTHLTVCGEIRHLCDECKAALIGALDANARRIEQENQGFVFADLEEEVYYGCFGADEG